MKNSHNPLIALHLSVLFGCAIPLGAILGPVIVFNSSRDRGELERKHFANIVNFQIIWTILVFAYMSIFWLKQIRLLSNSGSIDTKPMIWVVSALFLVNFIYPIIVAIIIKTTNRTKMFYPNIIRFVKYKQSSDS